MSRNIMTKTTKAGLKALLSTMFSKNTSNVLLKGIDVVGKLLDYLTLRKTDKKEKKHQKEVNKTVKDIKKTTSKGDIGDLLDI